LQVNTTVPPETFAKGEWAPVRVMAERDRIRLDVRGKKMFETAVPPGFDVLTGRWGLGAYSEVARFRKVKAE
jgi:hypothetical protein